MGTRQVNQLNEVTQSESNVCLGILGREVTPEISRMMDLTADQSGILVVEVESGSPAESSG